MAHDLFGDRFAGYRELGWPQIGKVFDDASMTAEEAGRLAGLFFRVSKRPMLVRMPDDSLIDTDKWMLVRDPTADDPNYRPFGVVSADYSYLQRDEVARLLDKHLTGKYPVETVGALASGKVVFYLLRMGSDEIAGDAVVKYLLVQDRLDGTSALRVATVVVRVVCANTLAAALDSALATFNVVHRTGHSVELEDRVSILAKVEGSMASTMKRLAALANLNLSKEDVEKVIKAAFPPPTPPKKLAVRKQLEDLGVPLTDVQIDFGDSGFVSAGERAQLFRQAAALNFERFNDEYPAAAGTGWALYNAIVEFADFRSGGSDADAARSSLFGYRAVEKARAFRELESLMKVGAS